MPRPEIVIVTPALADANNGNWQTAQRWARLLQQAYRVRLQPTWDGGEQALLIALHARRSAPAVANWRRRQGAAPLIVALTGTDLYRDIHSDVSAQASLLSADRLIVLNEKGTSALPAPLRHKAHVLLQSCRERQTLPKTALHLRALMVGHLRVEKSPETFFSAAQLLASRRDILLQHIGAALDPALGAQATALMAQCPRYRWLGGLPHGETRKRIQAAHVLVHPSRMEGGAHVLIEALRSGTAVLASHIDGNVGVLGADYGGYFPLGDAQGLATLLQRLRDEPAMLAGLLQQCAQRAPLFDPAAEASTLLSLVASLLTPQYPLTTS
jgi:putative glycosyltransferase (TIGR04348 family)